MRKIELGIQNKSELGIYSKVNKKLNLKKIKQLIIVICKEKMNQLKFKVKLFRFKLYGEKFIKIVIIFKT